MQLILNRTSNNNALRMLKKKAILFELPESENKKTCFIISLTKRKHFHNEEKIAKLRCKSEVLHVQFAFSFFAAPYGKEREILILENTYTSSLLCEKNPYILFRRTSNKQSPCRNANTQGEYTCHNGGISWHFLIQGKEYAAWHTDSRDDNTEKKAR